MIPALSLIRDGVLSAGPEFWFLGFAAIGVMTVTLIGVRVAWWVLMRVTDALIGTP